MGLTNEEIARVIANRPNRKFLRSIHSTSFINEDIYPKDKHFYYVSIYDENLDSNYIEFKGERILLDNSYGTSFIYNLLLTIHYCYWKYPKNTEARDQVLFYLIRYNLKKFYAEQLYNIRNCVPSRMLFLETLIYEQQRMIPVFENFGNLTENQILIDDFKSIGASIFSTHEMGHLFFNETDYYWNSELKQKYRSLYNEVINNHAGKLSEKDQLELKCDFLGLSQALELCENHKLSLNYVICAYISFQTLYALQQSAKFTMDKHYSKDYSEDIDLRNIEQFQEDYRFEFSRNPVIDRRASLILEAIILYSKETNKPIFEDCDNLPLANGLSKLIHNIITNLDLPEQLSIRGISRLIARSLHGHEDGMLSLYLRSKVFTHNRNEDLKVE